MIEFYLKNKENIFLSFEEDLTLFKGFFFSTIVISFNFLILCFIFPVLKSFMVLSIFSILISFVLLTFSFIVFIKKEENIFLLNEKKNATKNYRNSIKSIYDKKFKNSSFKNIFNEKIFVMIDLLTELSEKNLRGLMKERIDETIHSSLKLYLINLETASSMLNAQEKAEMDFEKDIIDLLEKNKMIIERLKEFITSLVLVKRPRHEGRGLELNSIVILDNVTATKL